jgi:hypothetical protein
MKIITEANMAGKMKLLQSVPVCRRISSLLNEEEEEEEEKKKKKKKKKKEK